MLSWPPGTQQTLPLSFQPSRPAGKGGDVQVLGGEVAPGGRVGAVSLGSKKRLRGSSKGMNAGDGAWAGAVRNRSPGGFVSCRKSTCSRDRRCSEATAGAFSQEVLASATCPGCSGQFSSWQGHG